MHIEAIFLPPFIFSSKTKVSKRYWASKPMRHRSILALSASRAIVRQGGTHAWIVGNPKKGTSLRYVTAPHRQPPRQWAARLQALPTALSACCPRANTLSVPDILQRGVRVHVDARIGISWSIQRATACETWVGVSRYSVWDIHTTAKR